MRKRPTSCLSTFYPVVPSLKVAIPLPRGTYHTVLWILTLRKLTGKHITQICFPRIFFPLLPKSTEFHIVSDLTNSCAQKVLSQSFRGLWRLCWANYLSIKVQENTDKYLIYFLVVGGTNQEQKKEKPRFVTSACFDSVNIPIVANFDLLWSHWMGNFEEMAPQVPVSWDYCLSHTNDVIPPGTMTSNHSLAHFSVLFPSIS